MADDQFTHDCAGSGPDRDPNDPQKPILLGGYAAKRCPVRIHNDFSPVVPAPEWVPSAELQALLDDGRQFEAEVFAELMAVHLVLRMAVPMVYKLVALMDDSMVVVKETQSVGLMV
jgi:hypothetical protein